MSRELCLNDHRFPNAGPVTSPLAECPMYFQLALPTPTYFPTRSVLPASGCIRLLLLSPPTSSKQPIFAKSRAYTRFSPMMEVSGSASVITFRASTIITRAYG